MQKDLKTLQGVWHVASLEVEGNKLPAAMHANSRIEVNGDHFVATGMGAAYQGTLSLDASANPRQIDMRFDTGPETGNVNLGIYELSRDHWRLCLATRGSVRPTRFESTAGSGFAYEVLTRDAAVASEPAAGASAAEKTVDGSASALDGEWVLVEGTMNGSPMEAFLVGYLRRVTKGDRTTIYAGQQMMMQYKWSSDESTTPRAIDYVHTTGPNKGKTQLGIYRLEGNHLSICMSAPGAQRPGAFRSDPGDGGMVTVWRRL